MKLFGQVAKLSYRVEAARPKEAVVMRDVGLEGVIMIRPARRRRRCDRAVSIIEHAQN